MVGRLACIAFLACVAFGEYGGIELESEIEVADVSAKGDVFIQKKISEKAHGSRVVVEEELASAADTGLAASPHQRVGVDHAGDGAFSLKQVKEHVNASHAGDGAFSLKQVKEHVNASHAGGDACAAVWDTMACKKEWWWVWAQCYTCGSRIDWVKQNRHKSDLEAKQEVAEEFPKECGPCDQRTCQDVAHNKACDKGGCWTCGQRMSHLTKKGKSEHEAGVQVADEFPSECGPCRKPPAPTPAPATPPPTPMPLTAAPTPTPAHTPAPPVVAGGDYKLMSYNVLYNNRHFWDIAGVIKNVVDPDIVNLQEAVTVLPGGILDALNGIGGGTWSLANPWDSKYYWCGLTAYRSDKWDLLWHKEVGIWQSNDQRGLCGALLKRKGDGTKLCVFGAHPVWRNNGDKYWAQDVIKKGAWMMKECSEQGAPSSFFCDCNTNEHDSVRRQLEASTGWQWSAAVHDGYDMIFVQDGPLKAGSTHAPGAVNPHAGQRGCKTGCAQRSWGYSDHPPVYVNVTPR